MPLTRLQKATHLIYIALSKGIFRKFRLLIHKKPPDIFSQKSCNPFHSFPYTVDVRSITRLTRRERRSGQCLVTTVFSVAAAAHGLSSFLFYSASAAVTTTALMLLTTVVAAATAAVRTIAVAEVNSLGVQ